MPYSVVDICRLGRIGYGDLVQLGQQQFACALRDFQLIVVAGQNTIAQFGIQLLAAVLAIAMSFGVTYALARALHAVMGLRVSDSEELVGLDISEHAERAYA